MLVVPALKELLLQTGQIVDEENAVQMINLVLECEREQFDSVNFEGSTQAVVRSNRDGVVTFYRLPEVWNTETSLT